jgi:phage FluMu gp28-like protein
MNKPRKKTVQPAAHQTDAGALDLRRYFLPYQIAWILDEARLVLCEKSIRVGMTFAQSMRAVRGRLRGEGNYLHTSVNERIGKAFVLDCKKMAEAYDIATAEIGSSEVYNPLTDRKETALEIYFEATKCFIKVFSSNPDALRGEGGEVGIDELTSHAQPEELLKAAGGRAMWGYPLRIWTSHRGADSCFNRLLQQERALGAKSRWQIVSLDLFTALDQGLLAKINETRGQQMTREQFIADTIALVGGQEAFDEECLLKPRLGGDSPIKWQWIQLARQKYDLLKFDISGRDENQLEAIATALLPLIKDAGARLGYDVARSGHLSAVWINRPEGDKRRLVGLVKIHDMKFGAQRSLIERLMEREHTLIGGGDKTGLGMQVCEELTERFGAGRFVGMNFSALKPELGTNLVRVFEDGRQIIPEAGEHDDVAHDFNALRQQKLPSGRVQFFESQNPIEKRSHCDLAWSCALANYVDKEETVQGYF